ncbi:uncharacterized protein KIAA0513-like isoform X2 [Orbicella faveolata]|uniref:uncharacterized protein KIAA0513-like isoform X2 n=1 Tax=Orbicella faveolata TaxID=48498 RepID=UPI0009E45286|nr:uncharacterized protein KIAA0513-like isoform X2 [Orbicella faveolata]
MTANLSRDMKEWADHSDGSEGGYEEETELFEQECDDFMKEFVAKIFLEESVISQEEKLKFGILNQHSAGRLSFSKHVDNQRAYSKSVPETIFFRLVQYFAIVLFECNQADDFEPAKILMNMCFTFFLEVDRDGEEVMRQFIVPYLRDQPIWKSLRFWNAAFFDAVHSEREIPAIPRDLWHSWSPQEQSEYRECDKNSTFGKLGTFLNNMKAFGLDNDICSEFLQKMSTIGELSEEQVVLLENSLAQASTDERSR